MQCFVKLLIEEISLVFYHLSYVEDENNRLARDKKSKKHSLYQTGNYNLNAALISGSSVFSMYALTLS